MNKIQYPVQVIDCIRDVILNMAWHYFNPQEASLAGKGFVTLLMTLGDWSLTKQGYLQDLGVNPAAWASRYARVQAIQSANDSVIISQQMFTQCLGDGQAQYMTITYKANLYLTGKQPVKEFREPWDKVQWDQVPWNDPWDGHTWPFGKSNP